MMPLPPHASVYSLYVRGFWFVAPRDFRISGLRVPSQAGTGQQFIHVAKLHNWNISNPPPFTAQSTNFTTLLYIDSATNNIILPANVIIKKNDTIGILGSAGVSTSYGNAAYKTAIGTDSMYIQRFGHQGNLLTGPAPSVWGVAHNTTGQIGRVEVYWVPFAKSPDDAGVEVITEPLLSCVGTYAVKARIKNFGKNKIDSVRVHWSVNAVPQTSYMHRSVLDTMGGAGANTAVVTLGNVSFVNNVPYSIVAWTEKPNNKIDTVTGNDTADLNMTGRAYPVVDLGNDSSRCPGDTIYLNSGSGHDSVRWSPSATTQIYKVFTPGTYSVKAYKWGCMGGDTIVIGTFPAAPAFNLGPDTTFCDGNNFQLNGPTGTGLAYFWQDSSVNSTHLVDTSGTFSLTVTTVNGCKSTDKIVVKLFAEPTVSISVKPSNNLCYGKAIIFTAVAKTDGSKLFQWKVNGLNYGTTTTSTTFSPTDLMYGDSVSVDLITDICATAPYPVPSNGIVMYLNPKPVQINGVTADTVIENTKKSYAIGITTGHKYVWRAKGGSILGDTTVSAIQVQWAGPDDSAWVSLQETDVNNCTYDNKLPVRVISIIGIDEKGIIGIGNPWPNPADHSVRMMLNVLRPTDLSLSIFDITGKVVMDVFSGRLEADRTIEVSTTDLRDGIYFCRFRTGEGYELVKKLVISH